MKPVFKCDYCSFMGTEEEVKEHETKCVKNYTRRSCSTCRHQKYKTIMSFECTEGVEVPDNHIVEFCSKYNRREESDNPWNDIIDAMLGGVR